MNAPHPNPQGANTTPCLLYRFKGLLTPLSLSALLALAVGCSKEEPVTRADAQVQPMPSLGSTMPSMGGNPAGVPPPPGVAGGALTPGAPPAIPAASTEQTISPYPMVDERGKPVTDSLQILQRAVYMYASLADSEDRPSWPPLKDLSQLVQYKVLHRLPAPPPGQKFVYNSREMKVTLAPR